MRYIAGGMTQGLSANLEPRIFLVGHLLPGLSTTGVLNALRGIVHPFEYNDLEGPISLLDTSFIGVVKMEVMRSVEPKDNFLSHVRKSGLKKGSCLFLMNVHRDFGKHLVGWYAKYGVDPDIAVYGKTLGNGYAVSAVVGVNEVMQLAQSTFISSTFWTERIGSAAVLKNFGGGKYRAPGQLLADTGLKVRSIWKNLAKKYGIPISVCGLPAISTFSIPKH